MTSLTPKARSPSEKLERSIPVRPVQATVAAPRTDPAMPPAAATSTASSITVAKIARRRIPSALSIPISRTLPRTAIKVVFAKTKLLKPLPGKGFTLTAADGKYTLDKAHDLLRSKLGRGARGKLRAADHRVLEPGERKPLTASALLKLRLEVTIGWAFAESGDALVPSHPYVASCKATLVHEQDTVIWPDKSTEATFAAKRPEPAPSKDQAAAIAKLTEAKVDASLDEAVEKAAVAAINGVFSLVPPPSFLAKRLAEGVPPPDDSPEPE